MVRRHTTWTWRAILATLALAGPAALPGAAEAAAYIWNVNADGSWTTASNWLYVTGTGPNTAGYPSGAGDQAFFTGTYSAPRTIVIPAGQRVTAGAIHLGADVPVTIVGGDTASRLVLDNGASTAGVTLTTMQSGVLNVVTVLRSSLVVTSAGALTLGRLLEEGTARSVIKRGSGLASTNQANTYTGVTRVEAGALQASGGGRTIPGNVEIAGASATLSLSGGSQLEPTASVRVSQGGTLLLTSRERVGRLSIEDGTVRAGTIAGYLQMTELAMVGGAFEADTPPIVLPDLVTATSSALGPARLGGPSASSPTSQFRLGLTTTLRVEDGPGAVDLEVTGMLSGDSSQTLVKEGPGTMRFTGTASNTYTAATTVRDGLLELARTGNAMAIPGVLAVGVTTAGRVAMLTTPGTSVSPVEIEVGARGTLDVRASSRVRRLTVSGGLVTVEGSRQLEILEAVTMTGGRIALDAGGWLRTRAITASSNGVPPVIDGAGDIFLTQSGGSGVPPVVGVEPAGVGLRVASRMRVDGVPTQWIKRGTGTMVIEGTAPVAHVAVVAEGTVLVNGPYAQAIELAGGALGGTGTVGDVTLRSGRLSPGTSPGRLSTGAAALTGGTFEVELNGVRPGTDHDQVAVSGTVTLGTVTLVVQPGSPLPTDAVFTIIANDGTDPVTGTFADLPEGSTMAAGSQQFTISYRGGDGNDVVLTATTQMTYYLAEGATGDFFDEDVLIANPNDRDAPVTLVFMKEGGSTVIARRTVPALSRVTVKVDEIPGLEATSASVQVSSDERLPLVVERTMFWDASYYGGHTSNAVARPETRWTFAEGFQGFFDTFILIANPNAEPATATLTFLREGLAPVIATVPLGPFARRTVHAGAYPDLRDRAFGIVVEANRPVIAERSMYFSTQPGRLWAGGHVNAGTVEPSRSWFHAEGATGGYFSTFILLSNPQPTPAQVELRFLLPTGDVISRTKTLAARQRLTVNPANEGHLRLQNAALSTVVQADVPVVSERSMYWAGEAPPFGEGHNSTGLAALATRWGFAEGRIGGLQGFDTFILLANPSTTPADVTVTYLREGGAPIVRRHTVPATSRYNVDVRSSVPELTGTAFGARVDVTNAVPIAAERSLYWNAGGAFWAGGTNALGSPLP